MYKCLECGKISYNYNEGQCPYCMTLDSLYLPRKEKLLEEEEDLDYLVSFDEYN